jgi:hypothetical protein
MPNERTRAVLDTRAFLRWLVSNCKDPYPISRPASGVPARIRDEAMRLLRHYPMGVDLTNSNAFDQKAVEEWYKASSDRD